MYGCIYVFLPAFHLIREHENLVKDPSNNISIRHGEQRSIYLPPTYPCIPYITTFQDINVEQVKQKNIKDQMRFGGILVIFSHF